MDHSPSIIQTPAGSIERLLRRDRWIVGGALVVIVVLAAAYTVLGVGMNMSAPEMTRLAAREDRPAAGGMAMSWTPAYALLVASMWWVMMIAMMTPGAAPMLLLYAAIKRRGPDAARVTMLSALLLAGYLLVWGGFSIIVTALQWGLEQIGLVDGMTLLLDGGRLAGLVLLAAGFYQFSPVKHACLAQCRSPARFLADHHRPGSAGALRIGLVHGAYCLGCCWALMALLFVGGIMNLYWIAGLALYVLAEKLLPHGPALARAAGALLVVAGGYLVIAPPG